MTTATLSKQAKVVFPVDVRCTQATLEAFGIFGKCPLSGIGVIDALREVYKLKILEDIGKTMGANITVKKFVETHMTGRYYITTDGHAMALIDGVLTDTAGRGLDRRHVYIVVKVTEQTN